MLTPRVRRTTTVVPPPPTEVESEVPSFEDDIFSTFGIRQGGVSHRKQSHAKTTATTAGVVETSSARERSLQLHKARIEHLRGKQEASNVRQQQAQERRQFLADHQNLRQAASWSVMMLLALSVSPLQRLAHDLTARRRRRQRMGGVLIYPVVMLGMRRSLRRARQRILSRVESYERPSHVTLRNDKILGLFPEHVLRSAAKSMTLRYFFPNEAILFVKCEDDEAYVLASGSADVMIGSSKVFTMQPGMVFGTIGMISGEPRSASIFARGEGVMVWVMKRAVFDAAGDSAAVSAAHDALAEVRQKNIMNVYKSRLDPPALGTFPLFYGLSNETLQGLLLGATPRIVRRGKVLEEPDQPMSVVSHMILLKGRVTIKVSPTPAHAAPRVHPLHGNEEKFSLAGEFRNAVDIPLKIENGKHPALLLAARMDPGATVRRGVRRASITLPGFADDVSSKGEYSVCAPALLNVNPLFLPGGGMMRPTPFIMTAATDCDLLCLSRKTLRTIDMLELATMQQNALNAHADFLGVQTKRDAAMMLLDNIAPMFSLTPSSQGVIATLRNSTGESMIGSMKLEKWVYPRGGYICFGTSNEFLVNIVLEGELEAVGTPQATTTSSRFPVWPSLADVWFAARDSVIRTTKRTVCLRIPRRDILAWFCRSLPDPQDLRTACSIFANNVSSVGGGSLACVLGFSTFDLDQMPCVLEDSSNSSAQTPLEMSRLARSSRGYSISFDVSETTVAAILRPVLQQIAEQLNRLQQRSSPQQGSAVTPTSAGGRGMHHKPTLTPHPPSSVPKSPMLNPANIYEASGITGHVSPLSIGVANKSTLVPGNGSSPTAPSARRPSSAAIRRPSSAVKTSLYPQPTVTVTPSDRARSLFKQQYDHEPYLLQRSKQNGQREQRLQQ
ncbi:cyclic nucleotide-binding protein, putative [Bodo saltans]|uniref:Cyclic nucleotide-binding protein, putative n=1 Tax=Bodo saltans TaxID=75058 RepID=A0A0S4J1D4_BODSA|nr:cyclic nucleotide-binding protein, putative [Bodo saltans]|eukprot:CUG48450.1 cyclic nucleotide-binding protein, putative [Bodo saltans]